MYGYYIGASVFDEAGPLAGAILTVLSLLGGAAVLDLLLGDPRRMPHPVVYMGKLIGFLESRWNRGSQSRKVGMGLVMAVFVPGLVFLLAWLLVTACYRLSGWLGFTAEILLVYTTIAMRGLADAAWEVNKPLREGRLPEARRSLAMIVGRDTEQLAESDIVRGTIETVAENTSDGIVAPLFWAVIGGAPAAMAYRAVNTLDSMVGYKHDRFLHYGRASAKLDDAANWLPARITALCMWIGGGMTALLAPGRLELRWAEAWKIVRRDAPKHPSPNSGWPEAMAAALLGVQLGGRNTYHGVISNRARMGDHLHPLRSEHIRWTVWLMHGAWIVFIGFAAVLAAWAAWITTT
ncbi:adenosylcobinamide-phosphate synthase CbiB [Xylanibacillus composti]|uniref:Cobalamin biosynthesis protein CobD n=1 Tax=Xylanibacillus composti TaxID=1572762 RepID=A0A8J4H2X7_9BACL|nr:adenosylcobinamide-phosphate synthase CbiB [Xylanibacillus composti]GIQ67733.1 cobalamin biosynthesis protein CobD [Xylanibacillus composti]